MLRKGASRRPCNTRTISTKATPVTTELPAYAYGAYLASLTEARRASEESNDGGFKIPGPYSLSGPMPSKMKPDVWAVYKAATAARYEVEFVPGLVLRLGQGQIFLDYYVTFDNKLHQRFHEASTNTMLISDLREFLQWLSTHPNPNVPYRR